MSDLYFTEEIANFDDSLFTKKNYKNSASAKTNRVLSDLMATSQDKQVFYKDVLRGLLSQVKLHYTDDQNQFKEIPVHHGRQERVIAKKFQENNIVLPYATIFQSAVNEDKNKRRYEPILVSRKLWNINTNRAERIVNYPDVPVILNYTLSVWCKYVSDLDQISSGIRSRFNPHLSIKTPETQVMKAFLSEETDRSVVEVNDREERLIRKEFTISIEAFIPNPKFLVTDSTKIKKINSIVEVQSESHNEITTSESPPPETTYYITWD